MKSRLLILFAFFSLTVWAEKIPQDKAREMALEFFGRSPKGRAVTRLNMINDGMTAQARSAGDVPALYVFDNPDGKGFVVMAGDDAVMPVLGYSFDNEFPEGELPTNLQGWMDEMKRQVEFARSIGMVAPAAGSRGAGVEGDVVVKLETALWDQTTPFNDDCPVIGNRHAVTGCVATAIGIVMRYHEWPEAGRDTIPRYLTDTDKVPVLARALGEKYDWDLMPLEYRYGEYSEEEAAQVARLLADVGAMAQMNYTASESGAQVHVAMSGLLKYMDYDKSVKLCQRYNYTSEDWYDLMKRELDAKRPIIYSGFDVKAGHTFVLDGYTTETYFSVNWGWAGSSNGYFLLDAMYPSGQGTGGNNTHFNFNQNAIIGIKKNEGGEYVDNMVLGEKGFRTEVTEFKQGETHTVYLDWLLNNSNDYFSGKILLVLTDEDGVIKEELKEYAIENLPPWYGYQDLEFTFVIHSPIEIGDRIRLFYQSERTPEWTLLGGGDECVWELLAGDEFTIEESTEVKYDRKARMLTLVTKKGVEVGFFSSDGTAMDGCMEASDNGVKIDATQLPAGTYVLKLTKKDEYKEVKIKLGEAQ